MVAEYAAIMRSMIAEAEAQNERRGQSSWAIPKKGVVVRRSRFAPSRFTGTIVFRGKLYPLHAPTLVPTRTLMSLSPVEIGDTLFCLELKGYGRLGREMHFQEHASGDVFYGMYLENVLREFERLDLALKLKLSVSLPLAAVEIPREEYIKHGMEGFTQRLSAEMDMFGRMEMDRSVALAGKVSDIEDSQRIARQITRYIYRHHAVDLVEGVRHVVSELSGGPSDWEHGIHTAADALLNGKSVGYLVRASKCSIRVGDPLDKDINTPRFREIARQMGHVFIELLKLGLIHHCPGTGNWTVAGEMTDFSDTFDIVIEEVELREHIEKLKKEERIEKADLASFVRYLIGPAHTGVLCPCFIEGMFGEKVSLERATANLLKLL